MNFELRHKIFLKGILLIFSSFLFFGRNEDVFQLMQLGGLLITVVLIIVILIKDVLKSKVYWIIITILLALLQYAAEPFLIRISYMTFINKYEKSLSTINQILLSKPNMNIHKNFETYLYDQFDSTQKKVLHEFFDDSKTVIIGKDSTGVFYGLSGFLDIQNGIYYMHKENRKYKKQLSRIKGNWYCESRFY